MAVNGDHPVAKITGGLYDSWGKLVANIGVPAGTLFAVIFLLVPKIDEGIRIANRVDGALNILAVNCAVMRQPATVIVNPPVQQP